MSAPFGFGEEVAVLNDELLRKAVAEQAPESARVYGQEAGAADKDVLMLRIDFQNVLRIDNLWTFVNLRKLQLDNNLIERIENLDGLVHLEWLDLSFNNIEHIEGLEKLTKLRDLSLHHNRITQLQGLSTLKQLEVLSVGENQLESLEDAPIVYLRQLPRLKCLNLAGNPLAEEKSYETFVVAYLPSLVFLDYRRIAPETRTAALVTYQDQLEIIMAAEEEAAAKERTAAELAKQEARYEDPEVQRLRVLPGVQEVLAALEGKFQARVDFLAEFALERYEERHQEQLELVEALEEGIMANNNEGAASVTRFLEHKQTVLARINERSMRGAGAASAVELLKEDLAALKDSLMSTEMDLVAQISDTLAMFERNYTDLLGKLTEQAQAVFSDLREMEEETQAEVTELAIGFLEALIKGEADPDVPLTTELQELLRDKTTLTTALATAHDNHLVEIDNKEDAVVGSARKEMQTLLRDLQLKEARRNRQHVAEIIHLTDYHLRDLNNVARDLN